MHTCTYTYLYTYTYVFTEIHPHSGSQGFHPGVPTPDQHTDGSAGAGYNPQPDVNIDIQYLFVNMSCPHSASQESHPVVQRPDQDNDRSLDSP